VGSGLRPPSGNVRDNRGIGVSSSGIGDIPKNCSGYCTRRTLGVQLELGAAAPHFEDRDFPSGECRTIVRDRGTAAGWHRDTPGCLPGSSPAASRAARRNSVPGQHPAGVTRTIVRLPDRTGHGPAVPARRPAWIKKFILGVDTLYSMG